MGIGFPLGSTFTYSHRHLIRIPKENGAPYPDLGAWLFVARVTRVVKQSSHRSQRLQKLVRTERASYS